MITPPFQVPDEGFHYYWAWPVSPLELVDSGQSVTLPDNVATLPDRIGTVPGSDWAFNSFSFSKVREMLWEPVGPAGSDPVTTGPGYGPIGYIPQATGVGLARILGHSPLLSLCFGRLLNLFASALVVFFAIRAVPFGKPFIALVALLPMFVFEMASLSADGLALSGFLLFLAIVLRLATRPSHKTADLVPTALVAVLLLNAKPGFAVLVLLVFMLRPRQFGGVRRYAAWIASIIAATVGLGALVRLVAPPAVPNVPLPGVDQARQLAYVFEHPLAFAHVLNATFDPQWSNLTRTAYGVLGRLEVFPLSFGMCVMVLAAILFLGYRETVSTTPWQRLVICATGGAFVVVVCLALYTGWTVVAAPVIEGLQGRCFILVLALGLIAIYGIRPQRERAILLILVAVVGFAAVPSIAALLTFFYI